MDRLYHIGPILFLAPFSTKAEVSERSGTVIVQNFTTGNIYLSVAMRNVTNIVVAKAIPDKTPRLSLIVGVPAHVVALKRPELGQLLLGEPLPDLRRVPLGARGACLRPARHA